MNKIDGIKQADQAKPIRLERPETGLKLASVTPERQAASADGKVSPVSDNREQRMAVIEAASAISSFVQNISRELRFNVDEQTGRTVIVVMDGNTDQVIRQIPGDEALALARALEESPAAARKGLLINSEV